MLRAFLDDLYPRRRTAITAADMEFVQTQKAKAEKAKTPSPIRRPKLRWRRAGPSSTQVSQLRQP